MALTVAAAAVATKREHPAFAEREGKKERIGVRQQNLTKRDGCRSGSWPPASVPPHPGYKVRIPLILGGAEMYRALGTAALLAIALAMPVQDAAAQDPVGGAILGGAAGAILGGAMGGGRGAAIGAIVGGATGAAIAAQGQPRPGGYRYYQQACYQQRGDGAWVVVAPEYCAPGAAPAVEVAPPPPRGRIVRDELQDRMLELRERCEDGDRRACVRLGILIGENRERRAAWRREHPEVFFYER
jgi:hypothetical protein